MNIEFISYPPIAGEVLRDHFWALQIECRRMAEGWAGPGLFKDRPRNPRDMLLEAYRTRRAQAIQRKWEAATRGDAFGSLLCALESDAWVKMTDSL